MRRLTILALATALILIVAATLTFALSYIGSEEQPPCPACKQAEDELPRASVCDITQGLDRFADKLVRIEGRFRNDAGQLSIEANGCTMHVGFDRERHACGGAWRKLQITCGVDTWYDGSTSARIVGLVATIPAGNYYAGERGFVVSCLETVQTNPTFSQRIRFVLARLF
jgi:hypothetical protein